MDSPHEIPNESLWRERLPAADADQMAWIEFALTFDGYADKGGFNACAAFADATRAGWESSGTLPMKLNDLRAALFFEQRRWRHSNEEPFTDAEWHYWKALVEGIRRALPA